MLIKSPSKTDIERLNHERYYYPCPPVQKRIHAVYYRVAKNLSIKEIAVLVDLNRDSVSDWIKRYEQGGFEALCVFKYGTNKSVIEPFSDSILASFAQQPSMSAKEASCRISKLTGISLSLTQTRKFLHRHGLQFIKAGHIPAKADTTNQMEWIQKTLEPEIQQAQNGNCHLLFMDAAHFVLQPFICSLWCYARVFIKASAGRNRINVLGALNAITKEIITLSNTTYINAETIKTFLKQLREHYPEHPIKIVLDNARYQHCQAVKEFAQNLNITLLFLPSYSPNLIIIERLWKFTKKEILYAKYYDSPTKFHNAITGFFQSVNQKYKDELQSLLSLKCQFFENHGAEIYTV